MRLRHLTGCATVALVAVASGHANAQESAAAAGDWPSYNRTLTSDRFAPLSEIDRGNVGRLKVLCTYDLGRPGNFQTGLIEVGHQLFGTTDTDTFSIDPDTCKENWRVHDEAAAGEGLRVNRGVAYLDGRIFRGTGDGRLIAYDAKTGKQQWSTKIAVAGKPETVPAAPIAWNGLVFAGIAGGDSRGVKGRMYALDARSGRIVWEAYLVPKTPADPSLGPSVAQPKEVAASWGNVADVPISGGGAWTSYSLDPASGKLYIPAGNPSPDFTPHLRPGRNLYTGSIVTLDAKTGSYGLHYPMVQPDFHDWDASSAPVILTTRGGKRMVAATPKDGHLYAFDLATARNQYRTPVTTILNATKPLSTIPSHYCPGTVGGSEWNGPAYDPTRNLLFAGQTDWCVTVALASDAEVKAVQPGQAWPGTAKDIGFGKLDPPEQWAGRFSAVDADTGEVKWRFKAPAPITSGVTPTAGGIVLFGDMTGTLYALDSDNGSKLWSQKIGGAIGGGVITYSTTAGQRVAAAAGLTSRIWPTEMANATVVVLGLR